MNENGSDGASVVPWTGGFLDVLRRSAATPVTVDTTEAGADHLVAWDVDQRAKAIHESGHAVVARVLGIGVKAIDIKAREGGHIESAENDDNVPSTTPDSMVLASMVVSLAGSEADLLILGQRTVGDAHDLQHATRLAYRRLNGGMDPDAPLFSLDGAPYDAKPQSVISAFGDAVSRTLVAQRERARVIVAEHRGQIEQLAAIVYARRRLSDDALDEALASIGLLPPRKGGAS